MSEWRQLELGCAISVKHGFAFKGEFFDDQDGPHIVLTPGNFHDGGGFKDKSGKEKFYDGPVPDSFLLEAGAIVVAMTEQSYGLLGSTATIPTDDRYLHNQRIGLIEVHNKELLSDRFVYHLLNATSIREQIQATATGSKVRHTAPKRICGIRAMVPPVATQRVIAEVLDSMDDLIENNRRRIEVLEEMAQAIYREWFVHFRYPGHEDATFVDSPLGPIPQGWKVKFASETLAINPRTKSFKEIEDPFISMGDLSEQGMVCFPSERKLGTSGSKFINGDTLFARITPCLENGKTGLVACLGEGQIGRGSTEFIVLRGVLVGPSFTYCLARDDDFRGNALASMSGASGRQRVRNECFDSYQLPIPSEDLAKTFEAVVTPMTKKVFSLARSNGSLASIRDLLLPKLVTGEIGVSELDLDTLVEATS